MREARRLVGEFVITERDLTERRFQPDSIALGSFYLDVHPVEILASAYAVVAEGNIGNRRVKPYEIPCRALLAKRSEARNLRVPVCLSASHVAYSSIRMEPVYMMPGHAAGVAAALSLREGAGHATSSGCAEWTSAAPVQTDGRDPAHKWCYNTAASSPI